MASKISWPEKRSQLKDVFANRSAACIDEDANIKLDTSIKRVTAFVKKLKIISEDGVDSILKEMSLVKFSKYFDEVLASLMENKFKSTNDVNAFVEVSVAICSRYPEFSTKIITSLIEQLLPKREKDEERHNITLQRQKWLLKILTELHLISVETDQRKILKILTAFAQSEPGNPNVFMPLLSSWLKSYYDELVLPKSIFETFFTEYFFTCTSILQLADKKLRKMTKSYEDVLFARGEVSDEQRLNVEKSRKAFERLLENLQTIAVLLDLAIPTLSGLSEGTINYATAKDLSVSGPASPITDAKSGDMLNLMWDTDEERLFYECVTDLRLMVPHLVLQESSCDVAIAQELGEMSDEAINEVPVSDESSLANVSLSVSTEEPQPTINASGYSAVDFKTFSDNFFRMSSKEAVDKIAVEYCYLDGKTNRKRLTALLETLPRSRIDLLPFVGRFIRMITPYYPQITEALVSTLLGQFRFLSKKNAVLIESRYKIAAFIGELTKFRVFPINYSYWCLKTLIVDNFVNYNIDMACLLLESYGRFLLHLPETAIRLEELLAVVQRKKAHGFMEARHLLMVDNAFQFVRQTAADARGSACAPAKVREPTLQFLHDVFMGGLQAADVKPFFVSLCKLNWECEAVHDYVYRRFLKVWKLKISTISHVAQILTLMHSIYPEFVFQVLDGIFEEFRCMYLSHTFNDNQKQIALAIYAGELFHCGLLCENSFFELLRLLLFFGYSAAVSPKISFDIGVFKRENLYDPPENCFRIFLICALLSAALGKRRDGAAPRSPLQQKRLGAFLLYFQLYYLAKESAGIDAAFVLDDCFADLPFDVSRAKSLDELKVDFVKLSTGKLSCNAEKTPKKPSDALHEDMELSTQVLHDSGGSDSESDDLSSDESTSSGAEDSLFGCKSRQSEATSEDDAAAIDDDFDMEYAKMLSAGQADARQSFDGRKKGLDFSIPFAKLGVSGPSSPSEHEASFKVLIKRRNNKAHAKSLVIPKDSRFVQSALRSIERANEEKQHIKHLTLCDYDKMKKNDV